MHPVILLTDVLHLKTLLEILATPNAIKNSDPSPYFSPKGPSFPDKPEPVDEIQIYEMLVSRFDC